MTVRVTKVKDHADEEMVQVGRVRELDRLGMRLLTLGAEGLAQPLLMHVVNCLVFVGVGITGSSRSVCWCSSQEAKVGSCSAQ